MRYLYFGRDDFGYFLIRKRIIFERITDGRLVESSKSGLQLGSKRFERATKRKLKVGEQIRIPEKEFAELFKKAEIVKP